MIRDVRLRDLLPAGSPGRLEGSGVIVAGGRYLVVCDNLRAVVVIDADLDRPAANSVRATAPGRAAGYEDIARDPVTGHVFLLIESEQRNGGHQARVEEYDENFELVATGWLEYPLQRPNKGMEGLEFVRRDGGIHLLGLHESGGLLVFRPGRHNWTHIDSIGLPFEAADYAGLALAGNRLAVLSQQSAALWVGELAPDKWAVTDPGRVYRFPHGYCTVEGVCWLGPRDLVVVSDRAKRDSQPAWCRAKEESLHLVGLDDLTG